MCVVITNISAMFYNEVVNRTKQISPKLAVTVVAPFLVSYHLHRLCSLWCAMCVPIFCFISNSDFPLDLPVARNVSD